jgi:hypothetical protein
MSRFLDVKLAAWAQSPPEHQEAAGGDPTSRDANDNESPLPAKGYDEGREERNDDEHGQSESQKKVRAIVEAIDARSVQVSMEQAKHGGQCCREWQGEFRVRGDKNAKQENEKQVEAGPRGVPRNIPMRPPANHASGRMHSTRREEPAPFCPARRASAIAGIKSSGLNSR